MRKSLALTALAVLALVTAYSSASNHRFLGSGQNTTSSSLPGIGDSPIAMAPTRGAMPAVWASSVSTIPELVAEADAVVRARVLKKPVARTVSFPGPILAEDGTVIGETVDTVTFSDTEMEVIEALKGSPAKTILVMQTGAASADASQQVWLEGDPLYVEGEELVLFLVDISNDPIHSPGRILYRAVNPAGRYTVRGSQVLNYAQSPSSALPQTVDELVAKIREAMK